MHRARSGDRESPRRKCCRRFPILRPPISRRARSSRHAPRATSRIGRRAARRRGLGLVHQRRGRGESAADGCANRPFFVWPEQYGHSRAEKRAVVAVNIDSGARATSDTAGESENSSCTNAAGITVVVAGIRGIDPSSARSYCTARLTTTDDRDRCRRRWLPRLRWCGCPEPAATQRCDRDRPPLPTSACSMSGRRRLSLRSPHLHRLAVYSARRETWCRREACDPASIRLRAPRRQIPRSRTPMRRRAFFQNSRGRRV